MPLGEEGNANGAQEVHYSGEEMFFFFGCGVLCNQDCQTRHGPELCRTS